MIRLVRLFTGPDGRSHVEESAMRLDALGPDAATGWLATTSARFQQSPSGSELSWHDAPRRQYVVTLTGTLEFTTRDGETFRLGPGDVLLAEDTTGGGHRWRLLDDQPWTRVYLQLP
ncbi:cupin domain-containing protein [Catellatospora paridis]|uniref:hypothetical protein n=1 Tax=Catellatospora paridis TaxID=1617086 RepID=UPI0012D3ED54|nr:hypothetical protein [Catellatospora paridis]